MSYQADTWVLHTMKYLGGTDAALAAMFLQAMERAGYPQVAAAEAIELILADFLAGPDGPRIARCERHPGWALVWCVECVYEDRAARSSEAQPTAPMGTGEEA